jgi:hypothetical protein
MKNSLHYIKQRGHVWYYQHAIPQASDEKRKAICFSLGTRDKKLASRLAAGLSLKTEQLIRLARMTADITFEKIDGLVKNHFERLLMEIGQEISFVRMRNTPKFRQTLPAIDAQAVCQLAGLEMDALKDAMQNDAFNDQIVQIAETLLKWKSYPATKGDQFHDYLCRKILQARHEVLRMKQGLLTGDPLQGSIQHPFFKDCVDHSQRDDYEHYLFNQDLPYHEPTDEAETRTLGFYITKYCQARKLENAVTEGTLDEEKQILEIVSQVMGPLKYLSDVSKDDTRKL